MIAVLHGQRKDATDILSVSELTTARCQTLLYLALLNACMKIFNRLQLFQSFITLFYFKPIG